MTGPWLSWPAPGGGVALLALAGVVLATGGVSRGRPATTGRAAALASLPWVAVAVALHVLAGVLPYPPAVAAFLRPPWTYVVVAAVCGLLWVFLGAFLDGPARRHRPYYVRMAGLGALLPPTAVLAVNGSLRAPELLAVWVTVPLAATLATAVVMLGMGLCLPRSGYFAGGAGAVVVFSLSVDGIGTALSLGVGAGHRPPPVLARAIDAAPLVAATAAVWVRLAVAVALVAGLAVLARRRPRLAEFGLGLAMVGGVLVAATRLLFALGGGFA